MAATSSSQRGQLSSQSTATPIRETKRFKGALEREIVQITKAPRCLEKCMLMFNCPATQRPVETSIETSSAMLKRLGRFKLSLWCPQTGHQNVASDAVVDDRVPRSNSAPSYRNGERGLGFGLTNR